MKTKVIDGLTLEKMLINGLNNLANHEEEINALNVFPVPDGDTGINMRLTLQHGLDSAKEIPQVGAFLKALSDGMLLGARGNSGVILSQIFRGIFLELRSDGKINAGELCKAFIRGYKTAYNAVVRPVEGTVLTVAREGIENIKGQVSRMTSIDELFSMYIAEMKKSLANTPKLLPVLAEAGVIDSGAKGYITIAEGMQKYLYGEIVERTANPEEEDLPTDNVDMDLFNEDSAFEDGYCCEFVLQLMSGNGYERFRENLFIEDLKTHGNSIVCVKNDSRVKVHVHSMKPGKILALAQEYGEFLTLKIENMQIQHNESDRKAALKKAPVHKALASVAVANGKGFKELFEGLGLDIALEGGMTMNSSANDFVEAFKSLDADTIAVFPNNKNIFMAAEQAKNLCPELHVEIIPTPGQMMCYAALQMDIQDSTDCAYRVESMRRGAERMHGMYLTSATRNYGANGSACKEGDCIAISDGKVLASGESFTEILDAAVAAMPEAEDAETVILFTGADAKDEEAEEIVAFFEDNFPMMDVITLPGGQPVYPYELGFM